MSTRGLTVDLNDKTALVTGASSGIGAAVAEALAASGAFVWVNHPADSTVDAAEAVVTAIIEAGGKAQPVQADVSEEADVLAMFSQVGSGSLDILVNNAGILRDTIFHKMTDEEWHAVIVVHLNGSFFVSRAAAPHFLAAVALGAGETLLMHCHYDAEAVRDRVTYLGVDERTHEMCNQYLVAEPSLSTPCNASACRCRRTRAASSRGRRWRRGCRRRTGHGPTTRRRPTSGTAASPTTTTRRRAPSRRRSRSRFTATTTRTQSAARWRTRPRAARRASPCSAASRAARR